LALAFPLVIPGSAADATVTVSEFGTPSANSGPSGIALGRDGNLWFVEAGLESGAGDNIGSLTPSPGPPAFGTEYPLPPQPRGIYEAMTAGRDGNLWFTDVGTNSIGRITPSGTITEFPIPTGDAVPTGITAGPDGNLWFTECVGNKIGRMNTSGVVTGEFPIPTQESCPQSIAVGPDGNLWFTEGYGNNIGRITPSGTITEFPLPTQFSEPFGITAGPDGNLWFTEEQTDQIGVITTAGAIIQQYPIPYVAGDANAPDPIGIAENACGGDLWFADEGNGSVGKVTTSGTVSVYPVPAGDTGTTGPLYVAWGPDGMWFTDFANGDIGRITDTLGSIGCASLLPRNVWVLAHIKDGMGGTVGWLMQDPGTHGVADASGLGLFGYSAAGGPVPEPYGSDPTFTYQWAGTYPYEDPFHPKVQGRVSVPMTVARVPGTTDEAKATWAVGDAPPGDAFDVQVEPPGSTDFVNWLDGVTNLSGVFGPSAPLWAGPGEYHFRARLRQLASGAASGYSTPAGISLH
jgi:streptogramin lyase